MKINFHNTGLYNINEKEGYPTNNTGVYGITNKPNDMGKFKVPTLRNIALTAPYMHDGSILWKKLLTIMPQVVELFMMVNTRE